MVVFGRLLAGAFGAASVLLAQRAAAEPAPASPPSAEPTPTPDAAESEKTLQARRHFKTGVKLYRDADYRGALAEFEAAYRDKPGAGSLQNTALCLKALFRYAEAAETLRSLLSRHAAELSAEERQAVQDALEELAALVGTLSVLVEPSNAAVTVNGRPLTAEERLRGVPLNVGEHTLAAEAPGYSRRVQVVRIASQQRLSVPLKLEATAGFLDITADDPKAAIAINGAPLAYHRWSGPVPADMDHTIQIYRPGFEAFETIVRVDLGQTEQVHGALGAPTGEIVDANAGLPQKPGAPPKPRDQRGWYGLATLVVASVNDAPLGLEVSASSLPMATFGARLGYRVSEPLAIEAAFDFGQLVAKGSCADPENPTCGTEREYSLGMVRFGPSLRFMTRGDVFRFTTGIGAGIVRHALQLEPAGDGAGSGGKAAGVDPYFSLELGGAFNYRHLLFEVGLLAALEGATELRGRFDGAAARSAFESETLPLVGLALKVGYSAWKPRRAGEQ